MGSKRSLLNNNGSTLAEIMISTVILALISLMLAASLSSALGMVKRTQSLNKFHTNALTAYYTKNSEDITSKPLKLTFSRGSLSFELDMNLIGYGYRQGEESMSIYDYE